LPPSVLPDISPSRGEIMPAAIAGVSSSASESSEAVDEGSISPLEGEMSGRTEGGNVERKLRLIFETVVLRRQGVFS